MTYYLNIHILGLDVETCAEYEYLSETAKQLCIAARR